MVKLLLNINEIQTEVEVPLINLLNTKNPKLKVNTVQYVDIKSEFMLIQKRTGVIVDEGNSGKQILAYVFLSPEEEEGGNSFVGQTIFPDLIDSMGLYINSPSFTPLNHPIYFINMAKTAITRESTKRDFAFLYSIGIHYLELNNNIDININDIPKHLNKFHEECVTNKNLEAKYYDYDPITNTLKILIPQKLDKLVTADGTDFKGSNEKYLWTEVLSISLIAINSGYKLNIEEFENFITTYENIFSANSKKMERCKTLMEFLKKIKYKKQYHEL